VYDDDFVPSMHDVDELFFTSESLMVLELYFNLSAWFGTMIVGELKNVRQGGVKSYK
jgi:hypothetical protein